jgi:hypothetical protein
MTAIWTLLASGARIVASWLEQRANPRNVNARVQKDEAAKLDDFRKDLKDGKLEEIRKHLGNS